MRAPRLDRRDAGAIVFLLLVTVAFHWPLITPVDAHRRSYPEGDFYDQFHAFASYKHERLWAGDVPLWNPYCFGGHPFLADVQAAVFYPPGLAIMWLSGPGPFSPDWLELEAIVHYALAAGFTYLFVRRLTALRFGGPQRGGAMIAALAFAFGGYMMGYPPRQLAILESQVWLPLILLLLDIGLSERRWPAVVGAGMAWGVALLAGHPQSAMYVLYAALAYGLYRAWRSRMLWWRCVLAQLAWMGIGFGLAAVQLLPALEFLRLSVRASAPYEELAGGFGLRDLAQYLVPGAFTHYSPVYVGIFTLCLAGVACWSAAWSRREESERGREWRADVAFWAGLAAVSLLLSLGGNGFVYRLFYWIVPGFNLFRSQERAIYLTSYALAVLAGYGWSWLATVPKHPPQQVQKKAILRWTAWGILITAVVSLVAAAAAWTARDVLLEDGHGDWLAKVLVLTALTWVAWGLVRWMPQGRWAPFMAVAIVLADLAVAGLRADWTPGKAQSHVYDDAWLGTFLQEERLGRIANEWGLPGNIGCLLQVQDLYGASPLRLQAHKAMADALPHWRLWQMLGVRYVATWEHDLPGPFPAQRVAMLGKEWDKNTVYVHRLDSIFPRVWVVYQAQTKDDGQALALLGDPGFDPSEQVLLSEPVPTGFGTDEAAGTAVVRVLGYAPEQILLQANLAAPGWLVLGEWDYPGWLAWVDGERQAVYRANYGLRTVPLAEGEHRVEFRYRPVSFYAGLVVSILTCMAVAVALIMRWLARTKRAGQSE